MQHQEWYIERERLLERIKELEAENAELRKGLVKMSHFFIKSARTRESQTLERCKRNLLTTSKSEIEE